MRSTRTTTRTAAETVQPCRWGLVVNGDLVETSESEDAIRRDAYEYRCPGTRVAVIRLPIEPV